MSTPKASRKDQGQLAVQGKLGEKLHEKLSGFNRARRIAGIVSVPGTISLYLVWYLADSVGSKLDRMIALLESIARSLYAR